MQKSGDGGVSRNGAGMDDESLAAAMEAHFAPFASAKRSLAEAAAIAGEMDAAHDDAGDVDADPEVTAITRKFEESHDTLGAITDLQQLLIQRTGQIPIIRLTEPNAEAPARRDEAPAEPVPVGPAVPAAQADEEGSGDLVGDWEPTSTPEPPNAPGFSPWVDPVQIAAAQDAAPARTYSDVSTHVFSVFAAKSTPLAADPPEALAPVEPVEPSTPEAAVVPERPATPERSAAQVPVVEPAPGPEASAPIVSATGSIDVTPRLEHPELDDDFDVIDDTDRVDRAVHLAAGPATPAERELTFDRIILAPEEHLPVPAPAPMAAPPLAPPVPPALEPEQKPQRRRWWLFGRR